MLAQRGGSATVIELGQTGQNSILSKATPFLKAAKLQNDM
jgi:hypothetical protein